MKLILVIVSIVLLAGCCKPKEPKEPVAEAPKTSSTLVTILDIRKTEDCEDQTLMEKEDKFRLTRCGYFGKVGDQFHYVE